MTVYYVDAVNGADSNPGTQSQPFRSLEKAASVLRANYLNGVYGDEIVLRAGRYALTTTLVWALSGGSLRAQESTATDPDAWRAIDGTYYEPVWLDCGDPVSGTWADQGNGQWALSWTPGTWQVFDGSEPDACNIMVPSAWSLLDNDRPTTWKCAVSDITAAGDRAYSGNTLYYRPLDGADPSSNTLLAWPADRRDAFDGVLENCTIRGIRFNNAWRIVSPRLGSVTTNEGTIPRKIANVSFIGCEFRYCREVCTGLEAWISGLVLRYCRFLGIGNQILGVAADGLVFDYNEVLHPHPQWVSYIRDAVIDLTHARHPVISRNVFHAETDLLVWREYTPSQPSLGVVTANLFLSGAATAIRIDKTDGANLAVKYNVFRNCAKALHCAQAIDGAFIYNNDFDGCTTALSGAGWTARTANIRLWDNIFNNCTTALDASWIAPPSGTVVDTQDNIAYNCSSPPPGAVNSDPLFADPANYDYRLQSGSPAVVSSGHDLGVYDATPQPGTDWWRYTPSYFSDFAANGTLGVSSTPASLSPTQYDPVDWDGNWVWEYGPRTQGKFWETGGLVYIGNLQSADPKQHYRLLPAGVSTDTSLRVKIHSEGTGNDLGRKWYEITLRDTRSSYIMFRVADGKVQVWDNANGTWTQRLSANAPTLPQTFQLELSGNALTIQAIESGGTWSATTSVLDAGRIGIACGNQGDPAVLEFLDYGPVAQYAPILDLADHYVVPAGTQIQIAVPAPDPDSASVTLTHTGVGALTGNIWSWTPSNTDSGAHTVTFTATDGDGNQTSRAITVTVQTTADQYTVGDLTQTAGIRLNDDLPRQIVAQTVTHDRTNSLLSHFTVVLWRDANAPPAGTITAHAWLADGTQYDSTTTVSIADLATTPTAHTFEFGGVPITDDVFTLGVSADWATGAYVWMGTNADQYAGGVLRTRGSAGNWQDDTTADLAFTARLVPGFFLIPPGKIFYYTAPSILVETGVDLIAQAARLLLSGEVGASTGVSIAEQPAQTTIIIDDRIQLALDRIKGFSDPIHVELPSKVAANMNSTLYFAETITTYSNAVEIQWPFGSIAEGRFLILWHALGTVTSPNGVLLRTTAGDVYPLYQDVDTPMVQLGNGAYAFVFTGSGFLRVG